MEPRRVLIVDDQPNVRELVRVVLRSAGCTVVAEAERGDEAIERAADTAIDVIVLDWEMPGGSGIEVLPDLRRLAPDARIIMFSSRNAADARPRSVASGADMYLEKSRTAALVSAARGLAGAPLPLPTFGDSIEGLMAQWRQRCARARLEADEAFGVAVVDALARADAVPASAEELAAIAGPDRRLEDIVRQAALLRSVLADHVDHHLAPGARLDVSGRLDRAFDELIHVVVEREASRLRSEAITDPLTGLGNRRAFYAALDGEVDRAARYRHPLSVVVIDLDGLKTLNDQEGHEAGDNALQRIATALQQSIRTVDAAFRIGGDEFVLLLPETPAERVPDIINRLRSLGAPRHSWGAASYGDDSDDRTALLDIADRRLLQGRRERQ